jgi:tRNA A37 threonylcarbamoyltransferase TsaD
MPVIFSIETSCDETAMALVEAKEAWKIRDSKLLRAQYFPK